MSDESIKDVVKQKYGQAALRVVSGSGTSCCSTSAAGNCDPITSNLYAGGETAGLPTEAVAASLGCGNPTALAELQPGETVLDLGSGGGIDVILSARRIGPTGRAIGLDMTDEMLELAGRNARAAGIDNVEFLKGTIEAIPLPAASVDVVISNCVINLAADKAAVLSEIARVLRPGGRLGVSDVVADDRLSPAERAERGSYVGCIAGALSFGEYREGLAAVGLTDVSIEPEYGVADGLHSAIVRAVKPLVPDAAGARPPMPDVPRPLAIAHEGGCGCGAEGCG
jgi:arsenite methyltransferase